jgi:hypothetical protein
MKVGDTYIVVYSLKARTVESQQLAVTRQRPVNKQQKNGVFCADKLENCCGSVVSCCCYKLVDEAADSSASQRNGNVCRWKPLPSNGSEDVIVDISVCV